MLFVCLVLRVLTSVCHINAIQDRKKLFRSDYITVYLIFRSIPFTQNSCYTGYPAFFEYEMYSYPVSKLYGFPVSEVYDYPVSEVYGYPVYGYPVSRIYGYPVYGYPVSWISVIRLSGIRGIRLSGKRGIRLSGIQDIRLFGILDIQLSGIWPNRISGKNQPTQPTITKKHSTSTTEK